MRKGTDIYCNCCGRLLLQKNGILTEDVYHLKKDWGYFSDKDGVSQEADICEKCLSEWMNSFRYAPESRERIEL